MIFTPGVTEAAAAALGAALVEAESWSTAAAVAERLVWRERFEAGLRAAITGTRSAGQGAERLWNTVLAILPSGESQRWLPKLDRRGFQVSTTAACAAAQGRGSATLAALGFAPAEARRALRFSGGRETTEADWRALLAALVETRAEIEATGAVVP